MIKSSRIYNFFFKNSFSVLCIMLLTVFIFIVGITLTSLTISKPTSENKEHVSIGEKRYTLIDNFLDADSFREFRHNDKKVNMLGDFYNKLTGMDNAKLLSMFNQSVVIDDFQGDEKFYYHTKEFRDKFPDAELAIKSMQMNQLAFEHNKLKVKKGNMPIWNKISFNDNTFPILLGSSYEGIYNIGDIVKGSFYTKNINFQVIGILEDNTQVYYKTDPAYMLDEYIIIPYPAMAWTVNPNDFVFEGILYFALVNSDIVIDSDEKNFLTGIRAIANSTGFVDFSLVGIDDQIIKNQELIFMISEHQRLIGCILVVMYIILTAVLYCQLKVHLKKNDISGQPVFNGPSDRKKFFRKYSMFYVISFILSLVLQLRLIPRIFLGVFAAELLILGSVYLIVSLAYYKMFLKENMK
ncbi:hypothetical protein NQ487_31420 [Hungatella hathewayi]|uniref:MacB-like periplasmic core domain-containing protein n=2 Tax=Hungatella hathewayi TaxID=154046 RepID=D3AQX3_9FIRM|nr:hypothetical protein [Hungatella hathewayi]EFC95789.1 hypothetical protein CLOSTHATH_06029 [Hungatella hathewayi DSM 13479]EHI61584.1 hypothetical protein HMPREF9473_00035 [ [Hungatella hathewayi WAL-18680]MDU4971801.1 hypothetical protein [Hungatella hathewayi]UWO85291.1 hypothetical protein NQ487_31420 [Hungatella hathewayi]